MADDTFIWTVRTFVYAYFAEHAHAPQLDDIARRFDIAAEQAGEVLSVLHEKHALYLEPGTTRIRLANPFSAIPTPFEVDVLGKTYWANCAWDSFGVIAVLHASGATIRSACAGSGDALQLSVTQGQVVSAGEIVHFLVPFRRWYDDLIFT